MRTVQIFLPRIVFSIFLLNCFFISQAQTAPSNIFISEYMEGASNDKFIEIFNGSGGSVDFSNLRLVRYSNGSSSGLNINLAGTGVTSVTNGSVWVVAHSSANSTITGAANQTTGSLSHNGDDAYELVWIPTSTVLDVFGHVGCDPGSEWTGVGNGTADNIIYRTSSYCTGASNPTGTCNASSFTSFTTSNWSSRNTTTVSTNTSDGIGFHNGSCGGSASPTVGISPDTINLTMLEDAAVLAIDSVTISGLNLTANANVSVSGSYTISFSKTSGFTTSLTATHSSGVVNTTVYVRMNAGLTGGKHTGRVVISDGAAIAPNDTAEICGVVSKKLYPGDLVFVGMDTYTGTGGPDQVSILALTDLPTGTFFTLANMVFEYKASASVRTHKWYNGNGNLMQEPAYSTITYTGSGLTAGDIICVDLNSSGSSVGTITVNGTTSTDFEDDNRQYVNAASSAPDAIWLLQGSIPPPQTDGVGDQYLIIPDLNVLGGFQSNGNFQLFSQAGNAGGSRISRAHPQIECFGISSGPWTGSDGWYGYYDMSTTSGSQNALLSSITQFANWTSTIGGYTGNDLPAATCNTSITVSGASSPGVWTGGSAGDSSNWFDCSNWENFTVPDDSTPVVIGAGTPLSLIDSAASHSDRYGDTARCLSLTLQDTLMLNTDGAILLIATDISVANNAHVRMENDLQTEGGEIHLGGDFTLQSSQGINAGMFSDVVFKGDDLQKIYCTTGAPEFASLHLDNPNHLALETDASVNNELVFATGRLYIGINDFTFKANADYTGTTPSSSEMIVADEDGKVIFQFDAAESFFFPIGDSTGDYSPIELDFTSLSLNGNAFFDPGVSVVDSVHPSYANSNPTISRYWSVDGTNGQVAQTALSGFSCDVDIHYLQADVVTSGSATEADLVSSKWNGSWLTQTTSVNTVSNILTFTGATSFSDFTGLPVDLVFFFGTSFDEGNRLEWATASELNNSHYIVEKWNGTDFEEIGWVAGNGTTQDYNAYQFIDPSFGVEERYRLRQVDYDGNVAFSPIVVVERDLNKSQVSLQENNIQVTIPSREEAKLVAFDLTGRRLVEVDFSGSYSLAKTMFSKGSYIIQVKYGRRVESHKVVLP